MSMAWEVSPDDVQLICSKHNIPYTDVLLDLVTADEVESAILSYVNFENQVQAALCEIEDQLIEAGIVKGEKKFNPPDGHDDWRNDEEG